MLQIQLRVIRAWIWCAEWRRFYIITTLNCTQAYKMHIQGVYLLAVKFAILKINLFYTYLL